MSTPGLQNDIPAFRLKKLTCTLSSAIEVVYGSLIFKKRAEGVDSIGKTSFERCNKILTRKYHMLLCCLQSFCPIYFFVQVMQSCIFLLVTSVSNLPSLDFTCITPALQELSRTWKRNSITNIYFPKSNTPVLSKVLSMMALHLARLVPPSLVMPTSFDPKVNWLIS